MNNRVAVASYLNRALSSDKRHRKSEKEEDAELLQDETDDDVFVYDESPACESR